MKTTLPTKILTAYKAKLVIESRLAKQIKYFVSQVPTECQWYTQVKRTQDQEEIVFTCYGDILIPPQKVGDKDVDMDSVGVAKMWMQESKRLAETQVDLIEADRDDIINKAMQSAWCWCHSHVRMPIPPSETDNKQWQTWVEMHQKTGDPEHPPMMLIVNKNDEIFIRVYDPTTKVQFENIALEIEEQADPELSYVQDAVATKLTAIEVVSKVIEPNKKYMEDRISPTADPWNVKQHNKTWGSGGSAGLREQLQQRTSQIVQERGYQYPQGESQARPQGTAGPTSPQTVDGYSGSYAVLNQKDIKILTLAFEDAVNTRHSLREAGFKSLYRWIDSNGTAGTWMAISRLLKLRESGDSVLENYLAVLRNSIGKAFTELSEGKILKEIVEFEHETGCGLDLLDAVVAFDAMGEPEASASLIDAFALYDFPDAQPQQPYQMPANLPFKVLDE